MRIREEITYLIFFGFLFFPFLLYDFDVNLFNFLFPFSLDLDFFNVIRIVFIIHIFESFLVKSLLIINTSTKIKIPTIFIQLFKNYYIKKGAFILSVFMLMFCLVNTASYLGVVYNIKTRVPSELTTELYWHYYIIPLFIISFFIRLPTLIDLKQEYS